MCFSPAASFTLERKRVSYCISLIDKSLGFEWLAKYLDRTLFDAHFILYQSGKSQLSEYLQRVGFPVTIIFYRGKKDLVTAFWKTIFVWLKKRPQIVHCHLFDASLIGLAAAWLLRIPKRLHTRHHGTLHHQYHPKAVWYDRFINAISTQIIAVSPSVKETLVRLEYVAPSKVIIIPHGFDLATFTQARSSTTQKLQEKYQLLTHSPVVGVISRFTHWKGIQYVIPAFKKLLAEYPAAKLVLANAQGDYEADIRQLLATLPPQNYVCIPFEPDVATLYHCFDVFVHVPVDPHSEAFGQIYVETMLAKVPMIATLSGVALGLLEHKKNAWVVPYQDHESIYEGLKNVITQPDLREILVENAYSLAIQKFDIQTMIGSLTDLYQAK